MEETRKCPYCGEEILAVAKKCKHCGEWLDKEELSNGSGKSSRKHNRTALIICAIIAVVIITLCLTCPDKSKHVNAIHTEIMQGMAESIDSVAGENNGILAMGLKVIGVNLASGFTKQFVRNYVNYNDYFLFSVTTGGDKPLSIGVLGHVFTTFTADDLKEKINDYVNGNGSIEGDSD